MEHAQEGLRRFRNHLPQWRLGGGIYFVTWCLQGRQSLLSPQERSIVADSLKFHHRERYDLSLFVVMDDHVHVLLQTRPSIDLSAVLKSWKGTTANAIDKMRGCRGTLWEKDSYTELLGNQAAIESRREYIYQNPARRWGREPYEYQWLEWFE